MVLWRFESLESLIAASASILIWRFESIESLIAASLSILFCNVTFELVLKVASESMLD